MLPTVNRHFLKLESVLKIISTETSNSKLVRHRRHIQSTMASLHRQSINLIKKEKNARIMRMKIDKIRRQATQIICKLNKTIRQEQNDEPIDVVDSENSELIVTQDDLDGEEQLERLENVSTFDSGIEMSSIYEKSSINQSRINDFLRNRLENSQHRDNNSDPIDLSISNSNEQMKMLSPVKNVLVSLNSSVNHFSIENNHPNTMTASTPIMNNLPSRRSTDDHLEQFMRVDPNQNIKWKQLADKFNKELGPNVCGVCHKTLSCKSALTMHYRVHTEERPFVCTVCEKRFSTKGNLKTHLGQHSDITDQFCVNNSLVPNQFKPGSMMMPPTLQSPTIGSNHSRISMPHGNFNLPFPGFHANPQAIFNMLNPNHELSMIDAFKTTQKNVLTDLNANCFAKQDDSNICIICRQSFQSKFALELHFRVHTGGKEILNCFTHGRHPNINWRERFQANTPIKQEVENINESKTEHEEVDVNHNTSIKKHQDLMNSSERFSLPSLIGLPNPTAVNMFSLMNNPQLMHRPMLPFPSLALANHLATVSSTHSSVPRFAMPLGSPINGFTVSNLSDTDIHK